MYYPIIYTNAENRKVFRFKKRIPSAESCLENYNGICSRKISVTSKSDTAPGRYNIMGVLKTRQTTSIYYVNSFDRINLERAKDTGDAAGLLISHQKNGIKCNSAYRPDRSCRNTKDLG